MFELLLRRTGFADEIVVIEDAGVVGQRCVEPMERFLSVKQDAVLLLILPVVDPIAEVQRMLARLPHPPALVVLVETRCTESSIVLF